MALVAGARLGPYEVLDLLGAGGMGEVYRARDPRLGREVAVKVLPAEVARSAQRLARFEHEARAVAALNHPNILTIFDVGTHAGVPYVVTELLEGETLRELLGRRAPTQRQVLAYAVAGRARPRGRAREGDRAPRRQARERVRHDGRAGEDPGLRPGEGGRAPQRRARRRRSPRPPEPGRSWGRSATCRRSRCADWRWTTGADIFSFGVVLYELLSGRHPFWRETTVATLTAILEETPPELKSLGRGVPPALSGIVRRCLEKWREERFHSAHDLALSLEAVLARRGCGESSRGRGAEPVPGAVELHGEGRGRLLRPRGGGRGAVAAPAEPKAAGRDRAFGRGQDVVPARGGHPGRPSGWAAVCATPGASPVLSAWRRRSRRSWRATRRRWASCCAASRR